MNIYETCPTLECEKFVIRLFKDEDVDDLLKVYSDKLALPFFNSDNCDGDNFYYSTKERMTDAIGFWHMAYEGCKGVLTKAPIYAVDRIKAIQKVGFTKSEHMLIGKTGYVYVGYWSRSSFVL